MSAPLARARPRRASVAISKSAGRSCWGLTLLRLAATWKGNYASPYLKFAGDATGDPHTIGVDANGFIFFNDTVSAYRLRIDDNGGIHTCGATGGKMGAATLNLGAALYNNGLQVVGARDTGWAAFTGTLNKATVYAVGTVTLPQLAGRLPKCRPR